MKTPTILSLLNDGEIPKNPQVLQAFAPGDMSAGQEASSKSDAISKTASVAPVAPVEAVPTAPSVASGPLDTSSRPAMSAWDALVAVGANRFASRKHRKI